MKYALELADLAFESANSSADPANFGVWVQDCNIHCELPDCESLAFKQLSNGHVIAVNQLSSGQLLAVNSVD